MDVFPLSTGATLMAAGASSPELFSSFVALFITHSSLGLGTVRSRKRNERTNFFFALLIHILTHSVLPFDAPQIVGSEIFNQLIICAGTVYASRNEAVQLNKAIVTQEVGFYLLSIILLYIALQDHKPVPFDTEEHIFIDFWEACMLFGGYILYVIVCANFNTIVKKLSPSSQDENGGETAALVDDPSGKRAMYAGEVVLSKVSC